MRTVKTAAQRERTVNGYRRRARAAGLLVLVGLGAACHDEALDGDEAGLHPDASAAADLVASPGDDPLRTVHAVDSFNSGALIIPMDTTSQDAGMLRAYGLVYALLRANVPVQWAIDVNKIVGGSDFTIGTAGGNTLSNREGGTVALPRAYRGGPFVISHSDRAAALPVITAWLASDSVTVVHDLTAGSFSANIARTLVAAPRVGLLRDGNEQIAFENLNAAGIPDGTGAAWSSASPDLLTEAQVVGPTTSNDADGALFNTNGTPRFCHVASFHYATSSLTAEVVQEVRAWLDQSTLGGQTHAYLQCESINVFENDPTAGRFLTTAGLTVDPEPLTATNRTPGDPLAQQDGVFDTDSGSVAAMRLSSGSFKTGVRTLINGETNLLNQIVFLTGNLDGTSSNGNVTYLGGHDFTTSLPVSTNTQANGVRLFLNSVLESRCASTNVTTDMALAASAPASTNASTITFTLTYTNGVQPAENVVLRNPIPAGLTFVSATGGGTNVSGVVTWNLGNVAAGAIGSRQFTASVSVDGGYANTATITSATMVVRTVTSNTTTTTRDGTPPSVVITSGPSGLTSDNTPTFTFVTQDATLTQCRITGAPFSNCTSPFTAPLQADGVDTFEVRVTDAAGNTATDSRSYTIDTTGPTVTILSGPGPTTDITPTFAFSTNDLGATFACRLASGAALSPCTSPFTTAPLADGTYSFEVVATDAIGNWGSATRPFTVDTVIPTVSITSGPSDPTPTDDETPTFTFSTTDAPTTVECRFDTIPFAPCAGQFTALAALADGAHVVEVRVEDAAGNMSNATRAFTVDTTPPDTTLLTSPANPTTDTTGDFTFSSADPTTAFQCRVDFAGAFVACTSPFATTTLADGIHSFEVRATDSAGNLDGSPAFHVWTVGDAVVIDNPDLDGDAIPNPQDNCPLGANPSQADADGDGVGDACDTANGNDVDGDTVVNGSDNCVLVANTDQADADGDSVGDVCDLVDGADLDGDEVINASDNCPAESNADQTDEDADGHGDACDPPASGGGGCASTRGGATSTLLLVTVVAAWTRRRRVKR